MVPARQFFRLPCSPTISTCQINGQLKYSNTAINQASDLPGSGHDNGCCNIVFKLFKWAIILMRMANLYRQGAADMSYVHLSSLGLPRSLKINKSNVSAERVWSHFPFKLFVYLLSDRRLRRMQSLHNSQRARQLLFECAFRIILLIHDARWESVSFERHTNSTSLTMIVWRAIRCTIKVCKRALK